MFVLGYVSMFLLSGRLFSWKGLDVNLSRFFYVVPVILNVYALSSILLLDVPQIGSLSEDILFQGLTGLLPLVIFILVMCVNAFVVYVNVCGSAEIRLYKVAVYLFAVIAVETCISIYAFHVAGLVGLRCGLFVFHLVFVCLSIWSYRRFNAVKIRFRVVTSDLLLVLLSVGVFMMVYIPYGLYNLYSDNSVVVGNTLSIANRESLQPYYSSTSYYSPIMGFISIIFIYITGFDNILLASNLPFLIGSLLLPIVTYHFLRSFITDDSRIALIGAIIVTLMDGLAVVTLPLYFGNITYNTIHWNISSATRSLYSSNILHLWVTPYKIFSAACVVAAFSMLHKKHAIGYLLGGAVFFISLLSMRYAILGIFLLIFLFGLRKIGIRGIILFSLSIISFGGFVFSIHFYKSINSLLNTLVNRGFLDSSFASQLDISVKSMAIDSSFIIILISVASIGIIFLFRSISFKKISDDFFTSQFVFRGFPNISVRMGEKRKNLVFSSITILSIVVILAMLIYVFIHVYSPDKLSLITTNRLSSILNSAILRYHILFVFFAVGLLSLKFNRRIALTIIALLILFFLVGMTIGFITSIPLLFVLLSLPFFSLCVKYKRKLIIFSFLSFVLLGLFSSAFYSATVPKNTNTDFSDIQSIMDILLEEDPGTPVYSPSTYKYYVNRILQMVQLRSSSDSNCSLFMIDKRYVNNAALETFLEVEDLIVLFNGNRYALIERSPT